MPPVIESSLSLLTKIQKFLVSPESRYSLIYLLAALLIYIVAYSRTIKNLKNTLCVALEDLSPFSSANKTDFKFFVGYMLGILTLDLFLLDPIVYINKYIRNFHESSNSSISHSFVFLIWTLVIVMVQDFFGFLCHWSMHRYPKLRSIHAIHHSAKTINNYTVLRMHPLDTLLLRLCSTAGYALIAIASKILYPEIEFQYILSVALACELIFISTAFLRHSSLPLNYPRWLTYIFVSPAMHLRHHDSTDGRKDKNFGRIFSFWDQIFNSFDNENLTSIKNLKYGLSVDLDLKTDSFKDLMLYPFNSMRSRKHKKHNV